MDIKTDKVRLLGVDNIPQCFELSSIAGWNQTEGDWEMLIELEPEGCFGLEVEGQVVATSTLVCYGGQLAWVGMVLTHPRYRRRGFARQVVSRALERARMLNIKTVKLDATEEGFALYASLGFRPEQPIERWTREAHAAQKTFADSALHGEYSVSLDVQACGYDRSRVLAKLLKAGYGSSSSDGHLLCRPGRLHSYLGPCVARTPSEAERLIACLQNSFETNWFWDILPQNSNATRLADEYGFKPVRCLTRMVLGDDLRGREDWIYGIAGFELG